MTQATATIITGSAELIRAALMAVVNCSPTNSMPLPPRNNIAPSRPIIFQCFFISGHWARRFRWHMGYRIAMASMQRRNDIAAGGTTPAASLTTTMLPAQHSIARGPASIGGGAYRARKLPGRCGLTQGLVDARHDLGRHQFHRPAVPSSRGRYRAGYRIPRFLRGKPESDRRRN